MMIPTSLMRLASMLVFFATGPANEDGKTVGKIRTTDGVQVAYTSQGQGQPAIVLVHGWTCNQSYWRLQVSELRKSFRVVTIDLPGHGASGANRASWSIDGLGVDVARVVRQLKLEKVVLVGHSMGGAVVLAAASKLEGIVQGVVAVDSLQNVEFRAPPDAVNRFVKRFEEDFDGARKRFMTGFFADPESEVLNWVQKTTDGIDHSAALAMLVAYNRFDAKSAMAAAGVPVRAINAAGAYPTEVEINRKHGDFDAVLMSDVGHFLMLEKPDVFNRRLRSIIDKMQGD